MANKGVYNYTVQEGTNIGLGQGGSMFLKGGTEYTVPTGQVIVSITFLVANSKIDKLESEDDSLYINTSGNGVSSSTSGPPGTLLPTTGVGQPSFEAGITIYGRWTKLEIDNAAIAYLGE